MSRSVVLGTFGVPEISEGSAEEVTAKAGGLVGRPAGARDDRGGGSPVASSIASRNATADGNRRSGEVSVACRTTSQTALGTSSAIRGNASSGGTPSRTMAVRVATCDSCGNGC